MAHQGKGNKQLVAGASDSKKNKQPASSLVEAADDSITNQGTILVSASKQPDDMDGSHYLSARGWRAEPEEA